jgi:hypothetical protein
MKRFILLTLTALALTLTFVQVSFADVGVGVGLGSITVDENLKQGMKYNLPVLSVLNTGDVAGEYTVDIAYHQDQEELLPPKEWFTFTPETFQLEPGGSQNVEITLTLPIDDVVPGDYFAYIEGKPIQNLETGETSIGVAAATKLYFTVEPSNIFEGIYYRVLAIYSEYRPYSTALLVFIAALIPYLVFRKNFNLDLSVQKKSKKDNKEAVEE